LKLLKFTSANVALQGISLACQFLVVVFVSQTFQSEKTASFFSLINYISFIVLLVGVSLESGLIYIFGGNNKQLYNLFKAATIWSIVAGIISIPVTLLLTTYFNLGLSKSYSLMYTTGFLLLTYFNTLSVCLRQFKFSGILNVVVSFTIICCCITYKNNFQLFESIYFKIILAHGLLMLLLFILQNTNKLKENAAPTLPIGEIAKYTSMAWICNMAYLLLYRSDYFFIEKFIGNANELGNYIQASKVGQIAISLPGFIGVSLFIFQSKATDLLTKKALKKAVLLNMAIAICICLPFLLLGKYLFVFAFGDSFNLAHKYFYYLFPGIIALAGVTAIAAYWAAKNKQIINLVTTLVGFILMAGINLFFLKKYGTSFAAIASSIAYIVTFLLSYIKLVQATDNEQAY
jgi:O-antigen/teichoic acid export membrane protein